MNLLAPLDIWQQHAGLLVRLASWLLLAVILWTLLNTVWFFLGGATQTPEQSSIEARPEVAGERPTIDTEQLRRLQLFGAENASADRVADAPETRLRLELKGVFLGATADSSSAIVAERGGRAQLYAVGDRLPGNAELMRVLSDRIVLRRGAAMETLRFPETDLGDAFGRDATLLPDATDSVSNTPVIRSPDNAGAARSNSGGETSQAARGGQSRDARELLNQYRERLQDSPDEVLRELGAETVAVGDRQGVRVDDVASPEQLAQVGLRSGDVVLSVNGQGVQELQGNTGQVDKILDSGSARIEIQRGERRFFVTTRIPGQ